MSELESVGEKWQKLWVDGCVEGQLGILVVESFAVAGLDVSCLFAGHLDLERDLVILLAYLSLPDFSASIDFHLPLSFGSLRSLVLKHFCFEFSFIQHLDSRLLLALGSVLRLRESRRSLIELGLAPIGCFPRVGLVDFINSFWIIFVCE